ncbi:hypothetical protein IP87_07865 [beta proteobacterium AAP121]|nr:hypothetical protein IP80_12040 [beta proteobacterium AAP65]KPF98640.1 hypothetical protein IP87_07865 [beta proteobacterium AAP121]
MMRRMSATSRRRLLQSSLALPLWTVGVGSVAAGEVAALLRQGGLVVALRHALAPGTFDPPDFKLGDCRTQRNLNTEGREQARRIGRWFERQVLPPAAVRSSPWCRCMDTAAEAFGNGGTVQAWAALGSPYGRSEQTNAASRAQLLAALRAVPAGRFELWVTHAFVQQALSGQSTSSGEGLLMRATGGAEPQVLGRLSVA